VGIHHYRVRLLEYRSLARIQYSTSVHSSAEAIASASHQSPIQLSIMSSISPHGQFDLSGSGITIPSDSENYDANNDDSPSPHSSSSAPMILYSPPTLWGLFRGAAINLLLPFINGLMLGFGELFAHEAAFRLGWTSTKVCLTTSIESRT
jgi:hypothetical protein